jgi:peptidyl-prolyl cis-trans isomerase SurA
MKVLIFLFLCSTLAFAQIVEPFERIVAVVDGDVIMYSDIQGGVQQVQGMPGFAELTTKEVEFKVLEKMIDEKVIIARARLDSIVISQEEIRERVESHLEQIARSNNRRLEDLAREIRIQMGMTIDEFRKKLGDQFRNQMIMQRMQSKYVGMLEPTPRDIQGFYESYRDSLPVQYNAIKVAHIQAKVEASALVVDSVRKVLAGFVPVLMQGGDFDSIARIHSQDYHPTRGSDIGFFVKGALDPQYERAAFNLELGHFTRQPVRTSLGWHIIRLQARRDNQIRTSHIFLEVRPSKRDSLDLHNRLLDLRVQHQNGIPFEQLAAKNSIDNKTRDKGGVLGWFERGELEQRYLAVVDTLAVGQVSDPVFIDGNWHLFTVQAKEQERVMTLADDWDKLAEIARNYLNNQRLQSYMSRWRQEVFIKIHDPELQKMFSAG